jgi:hypothetical protein
VHERELSASARRDGKVQVHEPTVERFTVRQPAFTELDEALISGLTVKCGDDE